MPRIRFNMDEIPDYQAPEPGTHNARLETTSKDVSQAGNDMIVWDWKVVGGDSDGKTIRSYTSLLEDALGSLKTHAKAFGFEGGVVDLQTEKLHGKMARIVCVKRKFRDHDTGEEREGVSIANVLPSASSSLQPSSSKGKAGLQVSDDEIPF